MASPIFNAIGNGGGNNPFAIVEQFINFANNFKGNPQQEVQKLLSSGQMTQQQLNALQGQATQFRQLLSKFPRPK